MVVIFATSLIPNAPGQIRKQILLVASTVATYYHNLCSRYPHACGYMVYFSSLHFCSDDRELDMHRKLEQYNTHTKRANTYTLSSALMKTRLESSKMPKIMCTRALARATQKINSNQSVGSAFGSLVYKSEANRGRSLGSSHRMLESLEFDRGVNCGSIAA
jgi:hypothetical protein